MVLREYFKLEKQYGHFKKVLIGLSYRFLVFETMEQHNVSAGKNLTVLKVKSPEYTAFVRLGSVVCVIILLHVCLYWRFFYIVYINFTTHIYDIVFVHVPIIGEHGLNVLSGFVQGSFSIR